MARYRYRHGPGCRALPFAIFALSGPITDISDRLAKREASKFSLALTAEPISVSGDPKSTLRCITSSPALELFISEALRIISDRSEPKLAPLDGGDPIIKLKKRNIGFGI